MALGSLTPTAPVVIGENGQVEAQRVIVTANAAEARMQQLLADAERMERIANGQENPTDADRMNLSFHLTFLGMAQSYYKMAEVWDARRARAASEGMIGRSQLVAATEVTGTGLTKGYHRGSDGKGRS